MLTGERLNGIRAFVQAEASGSFAAAAGQLGLSQSAVGKAISRLEARLGVKLFNRTTRHLSLTDEGRAYHAGCVRALGELEAAEQLIADRRLSPSGTLRMNLPDLFGRRWIMPVLAQLAEAHDGLSFDISFDNRFVDLAEEGYDLTIRIGRLQDSAGLAARPLAVQRMVICAAPDYLALHASPATPQDLAGHDCITQVRHGREEAWLFLDEAGQVTRLPVRGRHRFGSLDAIADFAVAGFGLAQLPVWIVADHLKAGRLLSACPAFRQPEPPIQALWLQSRAMAPRVRATVDALVKAFGYGSRWDAAQGGALVDG